MEFDIIHNGLVINTCDAVDADSISEMVCSMYPDNWTEINIVSRNHRAYHFLKSKDLLVNNIYYDRSRDYISEANLCGFKKCKETFSEAY